MVSEQVFLNPEEDILDKAVNYIKKHCPKSKISKSWTVSDIAERFYACVNECDETLLFELEKEFGISGKKKVEQFQKTFELFYAMYGDYELVDIKMIHHTKDPLLAIAPKLNEIPSDSQVMIAEILRVGMSEAKPEKIYARVMEVVGDRKNMRTIPTGSDGKPDFEAEKLTPHLEEFSISANTHHRNYPGTLGCFYVEYKEKEKEKEEKEE